MRGRASRPITIRRILRTMGDFRSTADPICWTSGFRFKTQVPHPGTDRRGLARGLALFFGFEQGVAVKPQLRVPRWGVLVSLLASLLASFPWTPAASAAAAARDEGPAVRAVYLDKTGVVRWSDSREEVALYGANYCVMSGSDYRMAGLVGGDRKAMIDEDMAQF